LSHVVLDQGSKNGTDDKNEMQAKDEDVTTDTPSSSEKEDDVSTTTSDDPVNMAMRVALGADTRTDSDEEEEDVVLFPRAPPEKEAVEPSGPTAQDLLLQVLGSPEPSTPKGAPRLVPVHVTLSARSSPRLAQPPLLFGSNIWSGLLPALPAHATGTPANLPSYGSSRVTQNGSGQGYAGTP